MLSAAHTLISLPFAVYMDNPILIFLAAWVFHLVADTCLHWNIFPYKFNRYPYDLVAIDIATGVIVAYFLLPESFLTLPVWAAIAGGNGPDVLHGLWDMLSKKTKDKIFFWAKPWFRFHDKLQFETNHIGHGLVSQLTLIALAIFLINW